MKTLKKEIRPESKKSKGKLAALCEALGYPSNFLIEYLDGGILIEVKIK